VNEDRALQGIDHLQAAAREMIAAARAFLDVAEDLVADRAKVAQVAEFLGSSVDGEPPDDGRVQHIKVS
jgi:hypothetical protein